MSDRSEPPFISRWNWDHRCEAVYWYKAPACGAKGPHKATSAMLPDHEGDRHEGNGFDMWGPKYVCW